MARYLIVEGHLGEVVMNGLNANINKTLMEEISTGLYPDEGVLSLAPKVAGTTPFEFLHLGLLGSGFGANEDFLQVPKGLVVVNWSMNFVNNWRWDSAQGRAEAFDLDYPMIDLEIGREGVLCHFTKPGEVSPTVAFHEITRFGGGVDGVTGLTSEAVPFNQFKAGTFFCYKSSTTPVGDGDPWWGGSGNNNPFVWMMSPETKGSDNEYIRLDGFTTYGKICFQRAQGTYGSKAACSSNVEIGGLMGKVYDGSAYQQTAQVVFVSQAGAISSGVAGTTIKFQTSATNTAGLATRFEITSDNKLGFHGVTAVARQVIPTGSTTDQLITALQNLGLISQS